MTTPRKSHRFRSQAITPAPPAVPFYVVASYDLQNVRRVVGRNLAEFDAIRLADSCRADPDKPAGHGFRVEPM